MSSTCKAVNERINSYLGQILKKKVSGGLVSYEVYLNPVFKMIFQQQS